VSTIASDSRSEARCGGSVGEGAPGSGAGVAKLDAAAAAFVRCQVSCGYDREWGTTTQGVILGPPAPPGVGSGGGGGGGGGARAGDVCAPRGTPWPVLVEEDVAVYLASLRGRPEDGWSEVVRAPERRQTVLMKRAADGSNVKAALASSVVGSSAPGDGESADPDAVFGALAHLEQYGQWDLSWQRVAGLCHIDVHNAVAYLVADSPPMPCACAPPLPIEPPFLSPCSPPPAQTPSSSRSATFAACA
jgi:hypothetical protein